MSSRWSPWGDHPKNHHLRVMRFSFYRGQSLRETVNPKPREGFIPACCSPKAWALNCSPWHITGHKWAFTGINPDSRSAINEDPPLKSSAKSWKPPRSWGVGPCAHTQCRSLHPSFFFLLSPPSTPAAHSLLGYASTLCRTAVSPPLERAAKSNTRQDTAFAKIPFRGVRRDICCVRFLCAGRARAESAPETEAAFFSFTPFLCAPLLFCFQASWTELQEQM